MVALKVVVIILLLIIFYEDFKSREVHLFLFLMLSVLLFMDSFLRLSWGQIWIHTLFNMAYLILIFALLAIYAKVRFGSFNFLSGIGIGDLLLLVSFSIWFRIPDFIFFTMGAFIVSLIAHIILIQVLPKYRMKKTVPLAGYVSLCMIGWVLSGSQLSNP